MVDSGADVVLVSQGLDHVMRPLARHLGVKWVIANRLEFRDGIATGRLLDPVIRPRGVFARITGAGPDGSADSGSAGSGSGSDQHLELLAVGGHSGDAAAAGAGTSDRPFRWRHAQAEPLSVRTALAGKHVMLIGVTGFIGKVWLVNTADGSAGDREDLFADPAAEVESGAAAV